MKNFMLIGLAALTLAACKPTEEQVRRVQQNLPEGCELIDLGQYGDIDQLVVIMCEGSRTVTTNGHLTESCGKNCTNTENHVAVQILPG